MIEICKAAKESNCQICKQLIEVGRVKIRCVVAGTHSESLCLSCCPQSVLR